MARSRKKETGRFSVLDRTYTVPGAALSYLQGIASRVWTEPNAAFVTDFDGTRLYKVERDENGHVLTYTY